MHWRWRLAQFFELRWWKVYLKGKPARVYLSQKSRYWQRVLALSGCRLDPGRRILDAGCGPAGIFMVLNAHQVEAVDPLAEQYERELPVFNRADYPWVRFFSENVEDFHPRTAYDCVFCLNVINHVIDIHRSLDVLADALVPGGLFLLSVDAHRYSWCRRLFQFLPGDILHPHQHDEKEYRAFLEQRGLVIQSMALLKEGFIFRHYLYVAHKL